MFQVGDRGGTDGLLVQAQNLDRPAHVGQRLGQRLDRSDTAMCTGVGHPVDGQRDLGGLVAARVPVLELHRATLVQVGGLEQVVQLGRRDLGTTAVGVGLHVPGEVDL